jgi:hypothetical protein
MLETIVLFPHCNSTRQRLGHIYTKYLTTPCRPLISPRTTRYSLPPCRRRYRAPGLSKTRSLPPCRRRYRAPGLSKTVLSKTGYTLHAVPHLPKSAWRAERPTDPRPWSRASTRRAPTTTTGASTACLPSPSAWCATRGKTTSGSAGATLMATLPAAPGSRRFSKRVHCAPSSTATRAGTEIRSAARTPSVWPKSSCCTHYLDLHRSCETRYAELNYGAVVTQLYCIVVTQLYCIVVTQLYCIVVTQLYCIVVTQLYCTVVTQLYCIVVTQLYCIVVTQLYCIVVTQLYCTVVTQLYCTVVTQLYCIV